MNKRFKKMFGKVEDLFLKINQQAIKEEDEEAKNLSCNLIEILNSHHNGR